MKKAALISALIVAIAVLFAGTAMAVPKAVGSDACKMCHKVQYESWAKSKHATGKERVDCETCHGPGSDYKAMATMRDPAKARTAGLIAKPDKASCTAKCHKANFKDNMLAKVHESKQK